MKPKVELEIQQSVDVLKTRTLDKLTNYLLISVSFLLLAFFYRLTDIEWKSIYFLEVFCFIAAATIVSLRKKISYKATIRWYIGLGFILTATEFIGLGLMGMGQVSAMFCIVLSLFFLDKRSTIIVTILVFLLYGTAFYLYASEYWSVSESDRNILLVPSGWTGAFVSYLSLFLVLSMSIHFLQKQFITLLKEVMEQKEKIEEQRKEIEYLANHDALTGLPTLRVANDRLDSTLQQATQNKHKSALLFLDLDGFKAINDAHGHDAGDELLKHVARQIMRCIRSGDTACRVGGDEFVIIMERVKDLNDIESLCQRLIKEISQPFHYKTANLYVGVSIGAASYPSSATTSKSLRLMADELMYEVKKSGKNNYCVAF
ncbi:diguanylate cyclase [Leucothrix sargassi]|nr:diguanylate cyclase [Leucothrix sargassi]